MEPPYSTHKRNSSEPKYRKRVVVVLLITAALFAVLNLQFVWGVQSLPPLTATSYQVTGVVTGFKSTPIPTSSSVHLLKLKTPITATLEDECVLQTRPLHSHVLARIVVFQRDGGVQLQQLVSHYSRVLGWDSLVIIDHLGEDDTTQALLREYGQLGVAVWRCQGSLDQKGEMWSDIVRVYQNHSDFVFPVDVDELLVVKALDASNNTRREGLSLVWNKQAMEEALQELEMSGKPYKLETLNAVPPECHDYPATRQALLDQNMLQSGDLQTRRFSGYESAMCRISFAKRFPVKIKAPKCRQKVFSRGVEFFKTDNGNHNGGTHLYPQLDFRKCMEAPAIGQYYGFSRLGLLHVQHVAFSDWLLHGLRGATDQSFTQVLDPSLLGCSKVRINSHYCRKWETLLQNNFSPFALRNIFHEQECPRNPIPIVPLDRVFPCGD